MMIWRSLKPFRLYDECRAIVDGRTCHTLQRRKLFVSVVPCACKDKEKANHPTNTPTGSTKAARPQSSAGSFSNEM